jgi:hypothetical protein
VIAFPRLFGFLLKSLHIRDNLEKRFSCSMQSEDDAAYLTAFLNSRMVSDAVSAYSSALSLGTSVTDYLNILQFDKDNEIMLALAQMAKRFKSGEVPSPDDEDKLDAMVGSPL